MMSLTKLRFYYKPTKIILGLGAADRVGTEAKKIKPGGIVLLVTDEIINKIHGKKIKDLLEDVGFSVRVYDKVESDPQNASIDAAWEDLSNEGKYDLIVGLGGGSSMDVGKIMALMATNEATSMEIGSKRRIIKVPGLPVIAIPTTAGTGAEVSANGMYHPYPVLHEYIAPTKAIVDPLLTLTMPPHMTATSGIDAFAHAEGGITAYRVGHPITDALSYGCIKLVAGNLRKAYFYPDDIGARYNMCSAALLGGLAIAESGYFGGHNHTLSGILTEKYGIPHGLAVASVIPYDMEKDIAACPELVALVAQAMGLKIEGLTSREAAYKAVFETKRLVDDLHIPSLKDLKVPREDLPELAEEASKRMWPEVVAKLPKKDILEILAGAWEGKLTVEQGNKQGERKVIQCEDN
jgi:alcohol dehydrogenase class IV